MTANAVIPVLLRRALPLWPRRPVECFGCARDKIENGMGRTKEASPCASDSMARIAFCKKYAEGTPLRPGRGQNVGHSKKVWRKSDAAYRPHKDL